MADTETLKADTDETIDIYAWKPSQDKAPAMRVTTATPWSRTWRIFAAGLIIGVATIKAAELLLHPGRKPVTD